MISSLLHLVRWSATSSLLHLNQIKGVGQGPLVHPPPPQYANANGALLSVNQKQNHAFSVIIGDVSLYHRRPQGEGANVGARPSPPLHPVKNIVRYSRLYGSLLATSFSGRFSTWGTFFVLMEGFLPNNNFCGHP